MNKITSSKIHNGTIKIYNNNVFVGQISLGEVRGEWYSEPSCNKLPELIKGKNNAISYLTTPTHSIKTMRL